MPEKKVASTPTLRERAEAKVCHEEAKAIDTLPLEEARQLLHELQVYQIELEMQNEELHRTQHELETSQNRYFDLYDLAPVSYLTLNEQGRIKEANLAAATLLGTDRKNLLNRPFAQFIFRDDQNLYSQHRKQAVETDQVQDWQMRLLRADGTTFQAHLRGTLAPGGEYWITLSDIAESKEVVAALRENEARLSKAQESAHLGSWERDLATNRLLWSDEVYRIFGFKPQEFLPTYEIFLAGVHPEDRAAVDAAYTTSLQAGKDSYKIEHRVVRKATGEIRYVQEKYDNVRDASGQVIRSVGMIQDITERKDPENKLREANVLLSFFIKHSPIYTYIKEVTSSESRVLLASDNFQEMIGIPGAEMAGKTMAELFPADMAAKMTLDDQTVVSKNKTINLEEELNGHNYHSIKFPIIQGSKTLLAGYTIDMTERKQAERVLQARLRISDYALDHSLDELLTKVLDEAEALTHSQIGFLHFVEADQKTLSRQTWSTNTLTTTCHAEDKGHHCPLNKAGMWADCLRKRKSVIHNYYESLLSRKGLPPGHVPIQREMVVPIFNNKLIVAILGVGNKESDYTVQEKAILQHLANLSWDIITRKRAEETLTSTQLKYSRLFESMTDAYACSDMAGRIIEANALFQQLTGYSAEELSSLSAKELTPAKWHALEAEVVEQQVLTRGYSDVYQKEYQRKDGRIITVELKTYLLKDDAGHPAGMWAIIRDITARKVAEEELRQAKVAADAANAAKSIFLANMSHEIRTPMNGVIGLIDLLLGTELNEEQRKYTELVKLSGKNLVELISNILDLSKIEAHKVELEEICFELREEITGVINLFTQRAREKGLELDTRIDPDGPLLVRGDAMRLRQILTNLIGNAIKFTKNGSIFVHVSKVKEDDEQTTLRFLVRDSGVGIAADKLEKLFAPFTQGDSSSTRQYGGTGLGLTIARQLAELMGGTIGVESREEQGATFWFTVVLAKQGERRATRRIGPVASEPVELPRREEATATIARILLAEDDPINQMMTKLFLTRSGYFVDVANNGSETIKALEENDYDLVLMDCMMPVLDGYEATAIIRNPASAVRNHAIPVVALTANAMRDDRNHCLAAGMDDYLAKPIEVTKVLAILEKWLHSASAPERDVRSGVSVEGRDCAAPTDVFNMAEFVDRSLGDLALCRSVVNIFMENSPEYIENIRIALTAQDALLLRQSAHKLKGAAQTLALPLLAETAHLIEELTEAGDSGQAAELFPTLIQRFEEALAALRRPLFIPTGGPQ